MNNTHTVEITYGQCGHLFSKLVWIDGQQAAVFVVCPKCGITLQGQDELAVERSLNNHVCPDPIKWQHIMMDKVLRFNRFF